jgi:ubiquinone/menaquinone biosynthesis C-methylase UbiE
VIRKDEPLFNAGAAIYDSFTFLRGPAELTAGKANILPGQKVLDIACGSGWATMVAARSVGENGHVTGIDIAAKLLEVARRKAALSGLLNIDYRVGDIHNLEFDDGSFDVVLCASSLFLFDDIRKALSESYRVLKTGGTMIFSTFGKEIFRPVMGLIIDYTGKLGKGPLPESTISITDTPEKCHAIFNNAGFENVKITQVSHELLLPDEEECWRQISASLIVRPRLSGLDPDDRKILKEEILPELEKLDGPRGISVDIPVILCSVKKL